ncbi:MAG: M18 family aminopeptidase [Gammaproteobacteria bacterium]|nr:M18 family aminopeptidase [Gammaproteobacteria bacterium]
MNQASSPATPSVVDGLLDFIARSPTPFHATANIVALLREHGFIHLVESEPWDCQTGNNYVVTRNDSSVIAFRLGDNIEQGLRMVGAHTDSPCLRIKPSPELNVNGYWQLGVEVYGGVLLHPWMDRDLSIAGRVSGVNKEGELVNQLVDFVRPIATIPNLAIHLDREANKNSTINPQLHLPLIVAQGEQPDFKQLLLTLCDDDVERILDYELSAYDTQAPAQVGLNNEFICAARLDNLLSSYVGVRALLDSDSNNTLYVSTDHEEVGSASACGARGPFLKSVLQRITEDSGHLTRVIDNSSLLSCDNAHGIHPNYADKHDQNHGPILNQGPVIKVNANQRYASNSIGSARFQQLCEQADVPVQHFVVRSDMGCGSTIGPITASELGVETLDIGAPQWAMHSIRETAGSKDIDYLHTALCAYLA